MLKTCIFGHGPKELPSGIDTFQYQIWLCLLIDLQILQGRRAFVSGVTSGVDLWCAAYIADLKRTNRNLSLHIYTEPRPADLDAADAKLKRAALLRADTVTVMNNEAEKTEAMLQASRFLLSVGDKNKRPGYLPAAEGMQLEILSYSAEDLKEISQGSRLCNGIR